MYVLPGLIPFLYLFHGQLVQGSRGYNDIEILYDFLLPLIPKPTGIDCKLKMQIETFTENLNFQEGRLPLLDDS